LEEEDKGFFEKQGLRIISAKSFWDVAGAALEGHPSREDAIRKLVQNAKSYRHVDEKS